MIWGVLGPLNVIYYNFMTCYINMKLDFGTLEKIVKLLVIYGAIPPMVRAEMAL